MFFINSVEFFLYVLLNKWVTVTCSFQECNGIIFILDLKNLTLSTEDGIRQLERGATIVCVENKGTKLVLQMPRGNLESIHPRCLVLSTLQNLLDK